MWVFQNVKSQHADIKKPNGIKKNAYGLKNAKATPTQTITQTQNSLTSRLVDLLTLDFRRI